MTDIVRVNNLSRSFGEKRALNDVTWSLPEGQVYGLLGLNGAGKTTMIKHLLGLFRAQQGSVEVFGKNPAKHPVDVLSNIGYLSEQRDLPNWMSIGQLMRYQQAYYANWDANYAVRLLDTFNLDQSKQIKNLSKGMRAQVGLIAAVAHRPRFLILDEPSSGLDAVVREDILSTVFATVREEGRTVLFSSHLLDEVERMSDHITMITDGSILLNDTLNGIIESHQISYVDDNNCTAEPNSDQIISTQREGNRLKILHANRRLTLPGIDVLESRPATLQEIFIARAGRHESAE